MAHTQPLSAYAKACRKINDSYQAEIKKSAWLSGALSALGPVTSAGIVVGLGVAGASLTPVTGPATLAVMSMLTVATGIYSFAQRYQEAKNLRASNLLSAAQFLGTVKDIAGSDGWLVAQVLAANGTLSGEQLDQAYWATNDRKTKGADLETTNLQIEKGVTKIEQQEIESRSKETYSGARSDKTDQRANVAGDDVTAAPKGKSPHAGLEANDLQPGQILLYSRADAPDLLRAGVLMHNQDTESGGHRLDVLNDQGLRERR